MRAWCRRSDEPNSFLPAFHNSILTLEPSLLKKKYICTIDITYTCIQWKPQPVARLPPYEINRINISPLPCIQFFSSTIWVVVTKHRKLFMTSNISLTWQLIIALDVKDAQQRYTFFMREREFLIIMFYCKIWQIHFYWNMR